METLQRLSVFLLRASLGWMFFYAGITKVLDPSWTAAGYIAAAKNFQNFYGWFLQPEVLPWVNALNAWGLTLVGLSLILGLMTRISSFVGIMLMLLYYFALPFPNPNANSFVVDFHLIYVAALFLLSMIGAGRIFGLDGWCARLPLCARYPRLRALFG